MSILADSVRERLAGIRTRVDDVVNELETIGGDLKDRAAAGLQKVTEELDRVIAEIEAGGEVEDDEPDDEPAEMKPGSIQTERDAKIVAKPQAGLHAVGAGHRVRPCRSHASGRLSIGRSSMPRSRRRG